MLAGGNVSLAVLTFLLVFAAGIDIKQHRIPNKLVVIIALYGLICHLYLGLSISAPFIGMGIGLLIFLPFYMGGGMGAGDVKLMSAVGATLGIDVGLAAGVSLLMGSLIGLCILLSHHSSISVVKSYAKVLFVLLRRGIWTYQKPPADHIASKRFPYAIAIALGTFLTMCYISGS